MKSTLAELYWRFYEMPKDTTESERIASNHRLLMKRLNRQNRKLVLRIIDDKDLICETVSLDSFIQGFRLGMMLTNEILNSPGGALWDTSE